MNTLQRAVVISFLALCRGAVALELGSSARVSTVAQVVAKVKLGLESSSDSEVPSGKIGKVIQMLENLIAEMDAEQVEDEAQFKAFSGWCTKQQGDTQASIDKLQATIQELTAALAELYSQKEGLERVIKRLKEEIKTTKNQIQVAQDKRAEEHSSFVKEQS